MSWAKIVQAEPAAADAAAPQAPPNAKSVAVVDTNAIIAGIQLHTLAEQLVTVPEVLTELRDARSRQVLEALPCRLHTREPSEDSLKAVTRFARATGELHSLSAVDLKVIALAYELELAAHGAARLRSNPAPPRPHAKRSARGARLPGWGDTGGDWAELDALADEEAAAAERSMHGTMGASRIAEAVQALDLNGGAGSYAGDSTGRPEYGAELGLSGSDDDSEHSAGGGPSNTAGVSDADEGEWQTAARSSEGLTEGDPDALGESSVACVTADFAMQNVLLQMGLRLVAPTGAPIHELRRWALRCSACFRVTKEVGRMFCPQCGNAALDKVEVVISDHGQEQFGVRKRHILRGTRFSLPKPAGGKNCRDPILREDVLLQRMPHLRAKPAEAADAFAPEYGAETWHQKSTEVPAHARGAAAAMASWRGNPNERSHARTNRRKR
ncbi:hypothetical protein WJX81_007035 [Elliptochloris bilobata]|uniref:RNA-binding protein NOB1 n=1 Tax=Elliptochloris bilobata TaxID=381761 RepID=A0AAW1QVS2_9CHLO